MWVRAAELAELKASGRKLIRHGKRQIVLFAVNGDVHAVDNRCPHEGYPLLQGTVDGERCFLTCQWHNWKFDLRSGEVLGGGDRLGTYPTRIEEGQVLIEIRELPPEAVQTKVLDGLRRAFEDRDYTRIAREISRLWVHGLDPVMAVRKAIHWTHDRLEWGSTHAFAATADWLRLYARVDAPENKMICLTEAVDHMADDALRQPLYPYPAGESDFDGDLFLEAIEDEDEPRAVAQLRGALGSGLGWRELEVWYARAALAHYNDYGHAAIYVVKTGQLLDVLGNDVAEALLLALTRMLCNTTREDLLPDFGDYADRLSELTPLVGKKTAPLDGREVAGGTIRQSMRWLADRAGQHQPSVLYSALLEASALNLLRFDRRHNFASARSVSRNVNWLGFTHAFTFANAGRRLSETYPELWPATLLQLACVVGRLKRFLDPEASAEAWSVDEDARDSFFAETEARVLDHGFSDPIYSAHLIKTYLAVEEEVGQVSPGCARYLTAALNRFFHEEIKEKYPLRAARQALALVATEA